MELGEKGAEKASNMKIIAAAGIITGTQLLLSLLLFQLLRLPSCWKPFQLPSPQAPQPFHKRSSGSSSGASSGGSSSGGSSSGSSSGSNYDWSTPTEEEGGVVEETPTPDESNMIKPKASEAVSEAAESAYGRAVELGEKGAEKASNMKIIAAAGIIIVII